MTGNSPSTPADDGRLWTKNETARFLGITERTLGDWMRKRNIPFYKLGKFVRFKKDAVVSWLDRDCRAN